MDSKPDQPFDMSKFLQLMIARWKEHGLTPKKIRMGQVAYQALCDQQTDQYTRYVVALSQFANAPPPAPPLQPIQIPDFEGIPIEVDPALDRRVTDTRTDTHVEGEFEMHNASKPLRLRAGETYTPYKRKR